MKKIYFICTGNSCRSQMAEGLSKQLLDSKEYEIRSGGIEAHGLNPRAVEVMSEIGIDISHNKSEIIDNEYINNSDLVITLCGDALDNCPVLPANVSHEHWGLEDPAQASGTEDEIMEVFRKTRDEIGERIKKLDI